MTESDLSKPEDVTLPLRDRIPEYVTIFALGWLGAVLLGAGISLFSDASWGEGVAYVAMGYGVVLLLAGGASGGGYTNLGMGAAGAVLGSGQRHDDDFDDAEVRRGRIKRVSPHERLRRGLRPEKNPRAFWQVISGFAYLSGGLAILELLAG
jgi:hypothetical protein